MIDLDAVRAVPDLTGEELAEMLEPHYDDSGACDYCGVRRPCDTERAVVMAARYLKAVEEIATLRTVLHELSAMATDLESATEADFSQRPHLAGVIVGTLHRVGKSIRKVTDTLTLGPHAGE